ncbi:MAG: response regulator, partial [Syntrophaceae bacterium]|nr:response regulator [Syntrophaceae bacterium]
PGNFYIKDRESRFLMINKALTQFMGANSPDDILGRTDHDFYSKIDADSFRQDECRVIEEEKPILNKEEYFTNYKGKKEWMLTSKLPLRNIEEEIVGVVGMGITITKRKLLEEQLLHAQKMETIGTLAGGLAHDLNNLLMGIQGHASLIGVDIDSNHQFWSHVKGIEEYVKSATSLTSQLLGFARGGKYEVTPTALNDLIEHTAEMFSRTHKEIRFMKTFYPELCVVEADKRQMEQVLLNLFINAWQAMPEGGDLYLKTENTMLDEIQADLHTLPPGAYAKISITDTGVGIDKVTQKRIFDPFFTTKSLGMGTGMGLASAYGIIKNHGGTITVYSEPNHGATFNIYLPSSDKAVQKEVFAESKTVQGSETILLVDDEDIVITVGKAMLEKLGYCVINAQSGEQAVNIVSETENKIDLMILDLIMPGMDGSKTFNKIREIRPDLPVILSSGYSINGQATDILKRGANSFIQKPFDLSRLSQVIRKILDTQ